MTFGSTLVPWLHIFCNADIHIMISYILIYRPFVHLYVYTFKPNTCTMLWLCILCTRTVNISCIYFCTFEPLRFGGRLNPHFYFGPPRSVDVWTRIPFFESFAGSRVNTPLVAVTNVGWCVYTPVFLGVRGNTLRCPRTKGTAVSEWVHSFVVFCLIPL